MNKIQQQRIKKRPKWDWEPERLIFRRTRENKIREKENKKISNRAKKKVANKSKKINRGK